MDPIFDPPYDPLFQRVLSNFDPLSVCKGGVVSFEKVDQLIKDANRQLNRVVIMRRDRKLTLRGSFPKKPGEGRGNKQRTIALNVFANPDGVDTALGRAQKAVSD